MGIATFKEKMKWAKRLIYFDENNYLREKARDRHKIQALINEAEQLFAKSVESSERYYLAGTMGNLYRVIGKLNRSIGYLNVSIQIAIEEDDPIKEMIAKIRLGEALKYANKHQKALGLFNEAIQMAVEHEPFYLDFAYQHKGKCLMEIGKYEEALEALEEAWVIRKSKQNAELLESTRQAIALLTKQLKQ